MNYEESLMVKAAWYYYFENMTQQAIAERLSVSRMRVIRLLENARQTGIIQFRLRSDGVSVMEQSQKLMKQFGGGKKRHGLMGGFPGMGGGRFPF